MSARRIPILLAALAASLVLAGTGERQAVDGTAQATAKSPPAATEVRPEVASPEEPTPLQGDMLAPNFNLEAVSINSGGDVVAGSAGSTMGLTIGENLAGNVSSSNWELGIGFWYLTAGAVACPIEATGDVNVNGTVTSADIISLVNYVFKSAGAPLPCEAAGDVNCDGVVTSADIIYLVGFVFKSGPAPCDVCAMIPGTWSCP